MKRVLLTGARAPVTLDLARSFGEAGHEVYLGDSTQIPLSRWSRYVQRTFRWAKPSKEPMRFVEEVIECIQKFRIDLLVPTCEEIFFIAHALERFPKSVTVFAEPIERLRLLHDKWEFHRQVEALSSNAKTPFTERIDDKEQWKEWSERVDLHEWVFKPVYSRFAARTLLGPERGDLDGIVPSPLDPWIAQRYIQGQEYSTYSIAQNGQLRAHACYRSEYRAGKGSGIYFVAESPRGVREFAESFIRRYGFTGQIGFDLIVDSAGEVYLLECNPRATSGLHMLDRQTVVDAFLQEKGGCGAVPDGRCRMLASIMMLYALPSALGGGRLLQLIDHMRRAKDTLFVWDDPLPALLAPLSLIEVMFVAWNQRKPLTRAATDDIEWNGEPIVAR